MRAVKRCSPDAWSRVPPLWIPHAIMDNPMEPRVPGESSGITKNGAGGNHSAVRELYGQFVEGFAMRITLPKTGPCRICEGRMEHVRTIPAAGFMPALHSFRCTVCGCPRTEDLQADTRLFAQPAQVAA